MVSNPSENLNRVLFQLMTGRYPHPGDSVEQELLTKTPQELVKLLFNHPAYINRLVWEEDIKHFALYANYHRDNYSKQIRVSSRTYDGKDLVVYQELQHKGKYFGTVTIHFDGEGNLIRTTVTAINGEQVTIKGVGEQQEISYLTFTKGEFSDEAFEAGARKVTITTYNLKGDKIKEEIGYLDIEGNIWIPDRKLTNHYWKSAKEQTADALYEGQMANDGRFKIKPGTFIKATSQPVSGKETLGKLPEVEARSGSKKIVYYDAQGRPTEAAKIINPELKTQAEWNPLKGGETYEHTQGSLTEQAFRAGARSVEIKKYDLQGKLLETSQGLLDIEDNLWIPDRKLTNHYWKSAKE
ncbi:MAG: hypothetical protein AABY09_02670, partial [Nanoarchaeota archaeon]